MCGNTQSQAARTEGFTIVELMLATMVFSVVLVAITAGVLHVTKQYYRGVTSSATQNTARNITDTVTNAIKFGTGSVETVDGGQTQRDEPYVFCAGGYVFVYQLGKQYKPNTENMVGMYVQPMQQSACAVPTTDDGSRRQLLGENMRVTYLRLVQAGGTYAVTVRVAYGDDDLLRHGPVGNDVQCVSDTGSEFCAVSGLTASAMRRLN